ncbi:YggS family pyridoxal phosphate-dependent enzyme [Duganella sp. FT80W]|uniref:Pyridoxal phosphate homeostasis protein n=1 Tax=Duganella guangzhouensis TaxID=2666084 RepID=A0A6I2L0K1_9BURK|nr:YggS family pyridoxal phosphate-dependent enzyme [Duganella guangzhouensis]MRW91718.1 YggS family pyridoxal phosphate-dependent enzyme [Duganella guangzhouensis]
MSPIRQNLQAITATIISTAQEAGREAAAVQLLAVSKTFGPEAVLEAVQAGQRAFGENYLQEGLDKIRAVQEAGAPALDWHFIGPIQSNKTRPIAENFAWVHTVEREKIAQRLSEQRPAGLPPLQICLQVNISGEASKSGIAPEEVAALAHKVAALPNLTLRGLMAIPEPAVEFAQQRAAFARLRILYEQLLADGLALDTLSMGMSADMRAAIFEGATIVRVGSAIFGARNYNKA